MFDHTRCIYVCGINLAYTCMHHHSDNSWCKLRIELMQSENWSHKFATHLGIPCKPVGCWWRVLLKEAFTFVYAKWFCQEISNTVHGCVGHPTFYHSLHKSKIAHARMPKTLLTLLGFPPYVLAAHAFNATTQNTNTLHYVGRRTRCKYIIGHKMQ